MKQTLTETQGTGGVFHLSSSGNNCHARWGVGKRSSAMTSFLAGFVSAPVWSSLWLPSSFRVLILGLTFCFTLTRKYILISQPFKGSVSCGRMGSTGATKMGLRH